jgi:hypothetical protein
METFGPGMIIAIGLLGLLAAVLWILWILMPFAVFGTKDLLKELIRQQKKTNELLIAEARRERTRDRYTSDEHMSATR